ncbi:methyltransferase type 11 [Trichlorobacter lovleyi SZ]|jgi:hypothetical protein|uniref:Methyltransferase type 11 n=1 Tax=Trichlorobacter lovleyi (strain ATCC BAA-1151 / DSM 17278 / SZ) TaxID=398767 RepID=B3E2L6_TRIL1|nr:methyltransferase type 11 [Trichlorobacter lovleyi SZ]
MPIPCKICQAPTSLAFTAKVLNRYDALYYQCPACGFLFANDPHWLAESYKQPITSSDTGILTRNLHCVRIMGALLKLCFAPSGIFADYGGGYGIFVRMMRDKGFNFYRDDKYCTNLFANGFDTAESNNDRFDLITAFELFEHWISPAHELEYLFQKTDTVIFTTELLPTPLPRPDTWWYYGFEHGQHISFYMPLALEKLAAQFGLTYYHAGGFHLFTRCKPLLLKFRFYLATNPYFALLGELLLRRKSLANTDFNQLTGNTIT